MACVRHVKAVSKAASDDASHRTARALRASLYLLAYNMVEATARNAVCAVFDRLAEEKVSFDQVRDELRVLILKHVRKRKPSEMSDKLKVVATDIFAAAFSPDDLFSGNVDARKLKETANQVGYEAKVGSDGTSLLTIKNNRNDLAHGLKTFEEVGREVSMEDLRRHIVSSIWYMRGVVRNVSRFVGARNYLAANATKMGSN